MHDMQPHLPLDKKSSKAKGFGDLHNNALIRIRERRQKQGKYARLLEHKTARGEWVVHMGSEHAERLGKRWMPLFNKFRPGQPYYKVYFAGKQAAECAALAFFLITPVTQFMLLAGIYFVWGGYIWRHMPFLETVSVGSGEADRSGHHLYA